LLPVLQHDLANHTQHLVALEALVRAGAELPREGAGLGDAATELRDLGWLMGVVAGACARSLPGARDERRGLGLLARALNRALAREGRALAPVDGALPAGLGWRGTAAVGEWLLACAGRCEPGSALRWHVGASERGLACACDVPIDPALEGFARELGGAARVGDRGVELVLELPVSP
jgi:hypothetical protein